MAVSGGVLLSVVLALYVGNMKNLFGVYVSTRMVEDIATPLVIGLLVLAYKLHKQRINPEPAKIVRTLLWFLSFVLFVIGWRFVAIDIFPPFFASNGFTVTGGFMMLLSGLTAGYLIGTKGKK